MDSGESRRSRCWPPCSDEDAQADGAGAGLLERLDLAETDESGELVALRDDGFGVAGPGAQRPGKDIGGELMEVGGGCGFSRHSYSV